MKANCGYKLPAANYTVKTAVCLSIMPFPAAVSQKFSEGIYSKLTTQLVN